MIPEGGAFVVPVRINDQITLKFVIDSGAADVSVPADVVMTLLRTGTIAESDFLVTQKYRMADGSTVPSQQFVIRSLKVGDRTLENVTGSIAPVEGSLLLGQSFLRRFKSWSIDNQREALILNLAARSLVSAKARELGRITISGSIWTVTSQIFPGPAGTPARLRWRVSCFWARIAPSRAELRACRGTLIWPSLASRDGDKRPHRLPKLCGTLAGFRPHR